MPREGEVKVKMSGTRPHDAANGNGSTNGRGAPTAYRPTAVGAKLRAPAVYRPGGVPVQGKMGAPAVYRPAVPVQARFGGSMTACAAVKAQGRRIAPEAYRPAMGLPVQGKIGAPGAYWPEVRGTGPGSSQVIQRIGQKPFGYTLPPRESVDVKDREELQRIGKELQREIEGIRAWAKEQKLILQNELLDALNHPKNDKSDVIRWYAKEVDLRARFSRKTVRDDKGFNNVLTKNGLEYVEDPTKKEDVVRRKNDHAVVLTIQRGDFAFVEAETQDALRTIYHKRGKAMGANNEYVQDDMGVFTRRYAYLEKNKHQYRDLLNRSVLEGRWPADQTVKDRKRPYNQINPGLRNKVSGLPSGETFTDGYQMVYVHQELGSGPQQRGVSATTTPVHEVFSNQGKSFRTDDGVRIQVDLAKVPIGSTTEPEFVNHYAYKARKNASRVIGGYAIIGSEPRAFDHYKWSVKKNREVFLKTAKPAFIKSVTLHRPGGGGDTTYEGTTLRKDIMAAGVNLAEYNAGFNAPDVAKTFTDPRATSTYEEGQRARREYNAGREAAINFWATVKSEWATKENLWIEGQNKLIRSENSQIEKENSLSRNKHKRRPLRKLWLKVTAKDYKKRPQDFMNFQNKMFSGRDTSSTVLKTLHDLSMEPEETRYVQGAWDGYYERCRKAVGEGALW
jgi:hypothetical protein